MSFLDYAFLDYFFQFRRCTPPRNFANHESFSKFHCKQMAELIDKVKYIILTHVSNIDDKLIFIISAIICNQY